MEFTDTNYHTGNRQATRIYTVQHRELYSINYNNLEWKIIPNIYIYIYIYGKLSHFVICLKLI